MSETYQQFKEQIELFTEGDGIACSIDPYMVKKLIEVVECAKGCFRDDGYPKVPISSVKCDGYHSARELLKSLDEALKKLEEL